MIFQHLCAGLISRTPDGAQETHRAGGTIVMRIFTICGGVEAGAQIQTLELKSGGVKIPAIQVGESGRGRKLVSIPVHLLPLDHQKWAAGENVRVFSGTVGLTKSGNPKIYQTAEPTTGQTALVVLETGIGFRGGNQHTGGRVPEYDPKNPVFKPFPGEILATGHIAQGDAGGMGSGDQIVAVVPMGEWFRTRKTGRLYGADGIHYHLFTGEAVERYSTEEAELLDLI